MRYRQKVRHRTLTPALLVRVQLPQLKTSFGGKMEHFLEKFLHGDLRVIVPRKHCKDFLTMLFQHVRWRDGNLTTKWVPDFDEAIFFCEYYEEKSSLVCLPYDDFQYLLADDFPYSKDLITFNEIICCDKDTFLKKKIFDKSIMDFLR